MSAIATEQPTGKLSQPIKTAEARAKCVELAKAGHSIRSIANQMGYASTNSVSTHLDAYRSSLTPSSELAEEWRANKLARADERFRMLGPKALGQKDENGEWITEPDYQALTALQREEEAIAKLLGANLEPNVAVNVFTREALAALVFGATEPVIEGTAVEVIEEGKA